MTLVDTVLEDDRWEALGLEDLAERASVAALNGVGLAPAGFEIVVMGCDDARIATLNADFRGKPQPTNVLSWPSENRAPDIPGAIPALPDPGPADDPEPLGDIAIALETCQREAAEAGKPVADHVTHLVIHGVLHLLGYDHVNDADATVMEGLETGILAKLGIASPYS
ncbi:MAG: rRNA maturation RNase YbeY [Qingshengfaniella sp.]